MPKVSILYPIKNRTIYNLYNLLPYSLFIDEIVILDSSDTPQDITDLVAVMANSSIEVHYQYNRRLTLPLARVNLFQRARNKYCIWMDSDTIIHNINFKNVFKLLDGEHAFVVPHVLNSRGIHPEYKGDYSFLTQFVYPDRLASPKDITVAGMYFMAFKKDFVQYYRDVLQDFINQLAYTLPSEDLAFSTFLRLATGKPGALDGSSLIHHIGPTNHDAWSFVNNRRIETMFEDCNNYDELAYLLGELASPKDILTLDKLYKSS